MTLGQSARDVAKAMQAGTNNYKDMEGVAVSLIVMFALIIPICMEVQNTIGEESTQRRTFMSLICLESDFREFAISTMEDPNTGDIGTYETEMFNFTKKLPPWGVLDIKALLRDSSVWSGVGETHDCEESPERRAAIVGLLEHFPLDQLDQWVLVHPEVSVRGDELVRKAGWAFNMTLTGLLGSLVFYMSLSWSPAREDETGQVMRTWARIGMPLLLLNFVWLLGSIVALLLAQDEWLDALYRYNMRDGNFFSAVNRQLNTFLFMPVTLLAIGGSILAYCMSIRGNRRVMQELKERVSQGDAGDKLNGAAGTNEGDGSPQPPVTVM
mmetsp:Transcript_46330/g.84803  ORF Transcript_46330/g.84803 Transcript_46330/m.84803 type:complete len:326 (-) Transcript_46330:166-1143(-)